MSNSKEENQIKYITSSSTMNKFGYLIVWLSAGMEIVCIWGLIYPKHPTRTGTIILMIVFAYMITIYLPYIQYKRKVGIDKENGVLINTVGYKEHNKSKEYPISDIKDYSIIRIARADEIRRMDPTLAVPGDSGTRAFHYIGYIEFNNGDILNLEYGSKRKVKKKINKLKSYIDGR